MATSIRLVRGAVALCVCGVVCACTGSAAKTSTKAGSQTSQSSSSNLVVAAAEAAKPPADAEHANSGLAWKVLAPGQGSARPQLWDQVKLHYSGWTTGDGKPFADSLAADETKTLTVSRMAKGWVEGVQLMAAGEKRRFWIPQNLAYLTRENLPPGTLVLDVELREIIAGKAPDAVPADVAHAPADARKTASGLAYKVLSRGQGFEQKQHPDPEDRAIVHYTGWTSDGKMFDTSAQAGGAQTFAVGKMMPGWTEALQLMSRGDKFRVWLPEALAFKGQAGLPRGTLVYDIELVGIQKTPKQPTDLGAAPAGAKKTASGLALKILKHGNGRQHPKVSDRVQLHATGWAATGEMLDSSLTRGQPLAVTVNKTLPGWSEALQLMVEGDSARVWIPEALAYNGAAGRPQGALVYDLELLHIDGEQTLAVAK